ncbi:hypothetical protein KBC75_03265 [Candidatus Shapirobacteria bacterium]|nr:hypothetical protein [Candidatus Shapirobacteria bacterium]
MMHQSWLVTTFLLITLGSCAYQYRHTTPTNFHQLNEMELVHQLDRMNQYPPATYRLAHIIEARPESVILSKLQTNFIDVFDINTIFQEYYWPIFLPLFLYGLFKIINSNNPKLLITFSIPIILLTFIGHQSTVGPACLYPSITLCIFYGIYRLKN